MHAQDIVGRWSKASETATEAAQPCHLGCCKEGGDQASTSWDHLPHSDSQWVSPIHVVPKKTGLTIVKNEKEEMIPIRVQNSWGVCIDYRRLNQETRKDHFPLPFIDQMLERLAGKSHYCFLVIFKFTLHLRTKRKPHSPALLALLPIGGCRLAYAMPLAHSTGVCIEVFMDDFTVYGSSFDACLDSLDRVFNSCIQSNLVLNFKKCHFMVEQGIVLGHIISKKGIEVDPAKISIISQLPYPSSVREVRSFLGHAGFYRRFIQDFSKKSPPTVEPTAKGC